jgi:hypothetical protein
MDLHIGVQKGHLLPICESETKLEREPLTIVSPQAHRRDCPIPARPLSRDGVRLVVAAIVHHHNLVTQAAARQPGKRPIQRCM